MPEASACGARARRPTQLLATECEAKKPNVARPTPRTIATSESASVISKPVIISPIMSQSTLRRPSRSASLPAHIELTMPSRYSSDSSPTALGRRLNGAPSRR